MEMTLSHNSLNDFDNMILDKFLLQWAIRSIADNDSKTRLPALDLLEKASIENIELFDNELIRELYVNLGCVKSTF